MDIAQRKQTLLDRRLQLVGHLVEVEHSLDETPPKDWEDRSSERQGDEVLESLGHVELNEVRRIDAALRRIEDGSYGFCTLCGDAVSEPRLDLLPDTPFCNVCAK